MQGLLLTCVYVVNSPVQSKYIHTQGLSKHEGMACHLSSST